MYITCKRCGYRGWMPVKNGDPIPDLNGCKRCLDEEIICIYCGAEIGANSIRCPECGALITERRSSVYAGEEVSEYKDFEFSL